MAARARCLSYPCFVYRLFKENSDLSNHTAEEVECNPIEGISIDHKPEQFGEAVFATEAQVCAEAPGSQSYYNLHQDVDDNSLRKVLARPVIVASGTLGATPGTATSLSISSLTPLRNAFTTQQWDRLLGFVGIRFTLVIHCVISKTAFHQGVLSLVFQYGVDTNNKFRGLNVNFPLSVHLPNVRLNMAEETKMELRVPFVSSEEYFRISSLIGADIIPYGSYALVNLTGCPVVAGQSTPRYTVYFSMEDVEFVGAQPFVTQTVVTQTGLKNNSTLAKTSSSKGKRVSVGEVYEEGRAKGVLSEPLERMADVARAVSYLPGLAGVGGAADWFLRASSGAAEAFGFSKPIDETMPSRHVRTSYAGEGQTDLPTIAYNLSAFQGNKCAIDGTVGCNDNDEMSFDHILTKYSYIYRGDFTTTQASGDVIYSAPVTPSAFWYRDRGLSAVGATGNLPLKSGNTLTENAMLPSTLCYLSSNFRYWRGNLKFRVTFANTKLHGGRVAFAFVPYRSLYSPAAPFSATRFVPSTTALGPTLTGYNLVFDLQDASSFEFEVPFVYPYAYCPVLESYIGDVSMTVVNPLTANVSVPSTVNFMVEVCAMPGFEFAAPTSSMMSPVPPTGALAISFQSGIGAPALLDVSETASQQCIGEKIKSVKSIMMMPDYLTFDVANATVSTWTLDPWFKTNSPALATPMPITAAGLYFAARSSRMAEMYAFARGASLYSLTKEKTGNITATFTYIPESGGNTPATNGSFYDGGLNPLGTVAYPEVLESGRVVVPLYSMVPRISTDARDFDFGVARSALNAQLWSSDVTLAVPRIVIRNNSGASVRCLLGRSAADDAICSQFIGPPPVIVLNTAASTNPYVNSGIGAEF